MAATDWLTYSAKYTVPTIRSTGASTDITSTHIEYYTNKVRSLYEAYAWEKIRNGYGTGGTGGWSKCYNDSTAATTMAWIDYEGGTYGTCKNDWKVIKTVERPISERMRDILRLRQSPTIIVPRKFIQPTMDIREMRARETLRTVLGEDRYRSYLRNGFISVRAASGKIYQIHPGHTFTRVFDNGNLVEELCIVLSGDFCPTDSVLMRVMLVQTDEAKFRSIANKFGAHRRQEFGIQPADARTLPQIMASLRGVAA